MLNGIFARGSRKTDAAPPASVSETTANLPASASRRRAAIGVSGDGGAEGQDSQALTVADVECLRGDKSADARALVARKLGDQADELVDKGHTKLVAAILGLLVKDVEAEVRRSLAEAMATSSNLPVVAARQLAKDQFEIARPILETSPVLRDDDLIEIVRTSAMQYSLAVAARDNIGEALSEALVDTGHQPVVARLLANQKAEISKSTYERVIEDFGNDAEVQQRLVRRMELPADLLDKLTASIGQTMEKSLVSGGGVDTETAQNLIKTATQNATITRMARDRNEDSLRRHMRDRYEAGELDHAEVLRLLREGDVASFEMAMSILAGVKVAMVRRLLYHADRRNLMALCVAAGFTKTHYTGLQIAIEIAEDALGSDRESRSYSSTALNELHLRYEEIEKDPETLGDLLDGEFL